MPLTRLPSLHTYIGRMELMATVPASRRKITNLLGTFGSKLPPCRSFLFALQKRSSRHDLDPGKPTRFYQGEGDQHGFINNE